MPPSSTQEGKYRRGSSRVPISSVTGPQRRVLGSPPAFREGGCLQVTATGAQDSAQERAGGWCPMGKKGANPGSFRREKPRVFAERRALSQTGICSYNKYFSRACCAKRWAGPLEIGHKPNRHSCYPSRAYSSVRAYRFHCDGSPESLGGQIALVWDPAEGHFSCGLKREKGDQSVPVKNGSPLRRRSLLETRKG